MTESEWLECSDPSVFQGLVLKPCLQLRCGRLTRRRVRLYGCACLKTVWSEIGLDRQSIVCRAEQIAEGIPPLEYEEFFPRPQADLLGRNPETAIFGVHSVVYGFGARVRLPPIWREIFGNPFRPSEFLHSIVPCPNSGWTPGSSDKCAVCEGRAHIAAYKSEYLWNDRIVPKLALSIYERAAWEDLPILADALEEAGSTDINLVNHLRHKELCPDCLGDGLPCLRCGSTGWINLRSYHIRGCWALDTILRHSYEEYPWADYSWSI